MSPSPLSEPGAATMPRVGRPLLDDAPAAIAWGRAAGLADPAAAPRVIAGLAARGLTFDLVESLCERLAMLLPTVSDPDRVLVSLERFVAAVRSPLSTATLFERDPESLRVLLEIFSASPHLAEIVIADPEAWEDIRVGRGRPEKKETLAAALAAEIGGSDDPEIVLMALRRFRRRQLLRIAYGDIVAGQRLETVVAQISHVADCLVAAALATALQGVEQQRGIPRGPDGRPATIAALALGKLGGGELNYSSDIDLVFVHSADGRVDGPKPCTNQEFFERVVQETVRLLSTASPAGGGLRVDLRLRPHGSAGPVSLSLAATLDYVDSLGRTWERQAWVKARPVAGDAALAAQLLGELEPWIYRRWLTRADIGGIKALKRRIERRAARAGTDADDVKEGRGGIRDVEFTIQFLQLLAGGDMPAVRSGSTLEAIRRLAAAGSLTDQEREILERTYTLLRTVEHRLQVLSDRQTHLLPRNQTELGRLAVRCGYPAGGEGRDQFRRDLAEATELNRRILDHLLHDAFPDDAPPEPEVDLVLDPEPAADTIHELLGRHHFRDPAAAYRAVDSLAEERVRFLSTRRCRHFLAAIAPRLLAAIGRTPDPDATLATLVAVADSLGGKGLLWELFSFHPPSLDLTVRLCSSSPFLARLLVMNPGMIDELLDSLLIERLPTLAELEAGLAELCRGAVDVRPMLQAFKVSQQLRVGVRDILGKQDAETTTAALTAIAEAAVPRVVMIEEGRLVERLGEPAVGGGAAAGERAGPVVLALGKFGGREMNYASDLDVVFLYDHDGAAWPRRRGQAGTSNAHFFGELAQRTLRVFNEFGPQGRLYEMDSRLRPSGRSGPPATSLAEFARYFAGDGPAAVWERQALVKARVVAASEAAAAEARRIIEGATYGRAWTAAEVESIRQMRYRMEEGAKRSNLKRGPGGVVDIEFIVQMLQLVHGGREPAVRGTETLRGLVALHGAGLLSGERREFLEQAYRTLRSIEGRLRLLDAADRHDFPAAPDEQRKLAHLLGYDRPDELVRDVQAVTARTRAEFERIFNETETALGGG
jgi:[glutamine synthetase] adenylyltransferase / [glutamine synthetase]-adenylyl-L-tyrosine phosphorylase